MPTPVLKGGARRRRAFPSRRLGRYNKDIICRVNKDFGCLTIFMSIDNAGGSVIGATEAGG